VKHFIANHSDKITGTLSGFDRLVFRGVLQPIAYVEGFKRLLWKHQVLLKDFGPYAQRLTNQLREASTFAAKEQGRPVQYLPSSATNKEDVAQKIARRDGITSGLIAVLSCLEPCSSYEVFRNRDTKRLELVSRLRKGLALYHYFIDPVFGFMNARIQTWLPFSIQICLNGREWLSHMMDKARLSYRRRDNCFPRLADPAKTQTLMDQQRRFPWVTALDKIARRLNPAHPAMFKDFPMHYY